MSIEHVPGWATSGTKTAPSSGLSSSGYVGGEQPAAVNFNYLTDEERTKINEIIDDAPDGFPPNLSDQDHIERRRIVEGADSAWAYPYDDANVIAGGSAKSYVDLCYFAESDGTKKLLALNAAALSIDVYNLDTMAYESTSGTLPSLPSGSGQTWIPRCMCYGAGIVYVCFADTNASPDTHQIQAYDVTTWLKYAPWPSTGTTLPGTGSSSGYDQVEFVGTNKIATTNTWNTISSSASAAVTILDSTDGTIDGSGAGDNPETGGTVSSRRLCGDGTYVYFTDEDGNVSSLTIATPTSGCGGTGWPMSGTGTSNCYDIIFTGKIIVSAWSDTAGDDSIVRFHTLTNANCGGLYNDSAAFLTQGSQLCFDGLCVWVRGTDKIARINHGLIDEGSTTLYAFDRFVKYVSTIEETGDPGDDLGRIVFDGRDIIIAPEGAASGTLSGDIVRIPRAVLR